MQEVDFQIDVFILKIKSILEVDFLNLGIYVQTQNLKNRGFYGIISA